MTDSRQTKINVHSLVFRKFKLPLDLLRLAEPEALVRIWRIARHAADVTGVGFLKLTYLCRRASEL